MMNPEILKLSPYCYPEQISSSHLSEDLNNAFSKEGFHITCYAPTPCRGIDKETRKKYKKIRHETRADGSIDIYRFSLFAEGKNPVVRALRYVLCNMIQYRKGIRTKNTDIVYSGSTPPTQGILCGKTAKKLSKKYGRKVPYIYSLQDVFPDSLVSSGLASKGSLLWKIGRKIEDKTYGYADRIIVISNDIKRNIMEKGVPEEKISVIPNWINVNEVRPVPRAENKLFDELGIDRDRFIVVYAGNLGMAQGIDTFIEAAKKVSGVDFLIFGDGSSKEEYIEQSKGCGAIHFYPLLPRERVAEVYGMGSIALVACKKGLGGGAVPSKTFSIMASSTPVLLSFDRGTELWDLIERENCGLCSEAGDADQLAEAIEYAAAHREELSLMGQRARECVEKRYSMEAGTSAYIRLFREMSDH